MGYAQFARYDPIDGGARLGNRSRVYAALWYSI